MRGIAFLFAAILMMAGFSANAAVNNLSCRPTEGYSPEGGVVVWPWGQEILFPWNGIQGVWQVSEVSCSKLYIFKVIRQSATGEKIMSVTEYDPTVCKVSATGKGVESRKGVVRAIMTNRMGSFELTIHAFSQNDVKLRLRSGFRAGSSTGPVFVMRMYQIGNRPSAKYTYRIEQIDRNPSMVCE